MTTTKKPTVAEAMAAVDQLHEQVVKHQETLNTKLSDFDQDIKSTLDQWKKQNVRDKENLATDFEDLRSAVTKKHTELSTRIEEIGSVIDTFRKTAESSRETTLEIKRSVDSLQESFSGPAKNMESPELVSVSTITAGTVWKVLKMSRWYPWMRFALFCVLGVLAYHFVLIPLVSKNVTPNFLPNILRPNIDPNSPVGAATVEVSRDPFRSDSASRETFGRIFDALDSDVRNGQLADFEAYYNEFGKRMQESLDGDKYRQWAEFWRKLAVVCHRHGGGESDLKIFNANLQAAARIVAGRVSDQSSPFGYPNSYENIPVYGNTAAGIQNANAPATEAAWPFVQKYSHP
jgi:hypothetical protein